MTVKLHTNNAPKISISRIAGNVIVLGFLLSYWHVDFVAPITELNGVPQKSARKLEEELKGGVE